MFESPDHVLAWSESLATRGVQGASIYLWQPAGLAAVLGLSQKAEVELDLDNLKEDGVPVIRRASGGGAVILMPGVLCFGCIANPEFLGKQDSGIHGAFRALTRPVIDALRGFEIDASIAGISDISVACAGAPEAPPVMKKISGTAQLRKKSAILVHGTILVDADISLLERYLKFPSAVPDYRAARAHRDFCVNAKELSLAATIQELASAIGVSAQSLGWSRLEIPRELDETAESLLQNKYRREGWNLRRERVSGLRIEPKHNASTPTVYNLQLYRQPQPE